MIVIGMLLLCVVGLTVLQYIAYYRKGSIQEKIIDIKKNNESNESTKNTQKVIKNETNQNHMLKGDRQQA